MNILEAALLGLVEGLTEFLPVSSTGHLMLTSSLLGIPDSEFVGAFEVIIQFGAILAIVALFPKRLFTDRATMLRIAAGFVPTAILGALFYPVIKAHLFGNIPLILYALILGGVFILYFEKKIGNRSGTTIAEIPLWRAAMIGALQAVAFIPGVSRSLATIAGGMWLGLSRKEAVEFSFFLAVPTMAAASGLDLVKNASAFSSDDTVALLVGFVVSFAVALFSVRLLTRWVSEHDLSIFGYYRILAAVVFALIVL